MQKLRGILTGLVIAILVAAVVRLWLHGTLEASAGIGAIVGIATTLVVGTRTDARSEAADAAWRAASPDLPPASDRSALELTQRSMPGPAAYPVPAPAPAADPAAPAPAGAPAAPALTPTAMAASPATAPALSVGEIEDPGAAI